MQSSWIRGAFLSILLGPETGGAVVPQAGNLPLDQFARRLEQERAGSGDPLFAWHRGAGMDLSSLGLTGQAVGPRRTLGQALRTFERGFPLLQSNSTFRMEIVGDQAQIRYRVLDPRIWPRRADAELTLGVIAAIMARYDVSPAAIRDLAFEHEPDGELSALARHLGRVPRFGQEENRITISAAALSRTLRPGAIGADPADAPDDARLNDALAELRHQTPVAHRVFGVIMAQMAQGPIGQPAVAAVLGLSERSLRRVLAAEGQPFHDILEECRRIHGFALLTRSDRLFGEIATLLGYSDQTAFSRAFSRWYGASPRELRKFGIEEVSVIR